MSHVSGFKCGAAFQAAMAGRMPAPHSSRLRKPVFVAFILLLGALGCNSSETPEVRDSMPLDSETYLFSYFTDQDSGLKLCYSRDLYRWVDIPGPHLKPEIGDKIMRDPFLAQGPDGTYQLVWTTGWGRKDIGYSSSSDLIHWSAQKLLPVMGNRRGVQNCWAPKLFYDETNQQWMILWSTWLDDGTFPSPDLPETSKQHRIFYTTTRDFQNFSETRLLFDPGYSCIDAFLLNDGHQFVLFFKDERGNDAEEPRPGWQNIRMAIADNPYGPFPHISEPITGQGSGTWHNEGPCAVKRGEEYFVLYDHHGPPLPTYFGATRSTDLKDWKDISHLMSFPPGAKHGSIIRVRSGDIAALIGTVR